jgi:predicted Fe-S protein YdhL (DUF1289 family)
MSGDLHEAQVVSPCVNTCVIDQQSGWCVGCYRTLDEIAGWIDLSPAARRAIVAELPERRARHGAHRADHGQR